MASEDGVSSFLNDVLCYDDGNQLPQGTRSIESARYIYRTLVEPLQSLQEVGGLPVSREGTSRFVIETLCELKLEKDLKHFLEYYKFPLPENFEVSFIPVASGVPPSFSLITNIVAEEDIADGDGFHAWVRVIDFFQVPKDMLNNIHMYVDATMNNNFYKASTYKKKIEHDRMYRISYINDEELLERKYKIRLRGIDAPELDQDYGKEAKTELSNAIVGRRVSLQAYDMDPYNRCVADAYVDKILIQKTLLEKGAAWHAPRFDNRQELIECQEAAMRDKLGLWAYPNPMSPWVWKRMKKQNIQIMH